MTGEGRELKGKCNALTFRAVHQKHIINIPSNSNFNSRRASLLSLRSCFSISWFIRFCSLASSLKQHAMFMSNIGRGSFLKIPPKDYLGAVHQTDRVPQYDPNPSALTGQIELPKPFLNRSNIPGYNIFLPIPNSHPNSGCGE